MPKGALFVLIVLAYLAALAGLWFRPDSNDGMDGSAAAGYSVIAATFALVAAIGFVCNY